MRSRRGTVALAFFALTLALRRTPAARPHA
jgi:hypothetical protein